MNRLIVLTLLMICQSLVMPCAGAGPLPVELFAREIAFSAIKLSTDGKSMAMITGEDQRDRLTFIDLQSNNRTNSVTTRDQDRIFDFEWVTPSRVVILIASKISEGVRPSPSGDLYTAVRDHGPLSALLRVGDLLRNDGALETLDELEGTFKGRDDDEIQISVHPQRSPTQQLPYYTPASFPKPFLETLNLRLRRTSQYEPLPLVGARLLSDQQDKVRFAIGYDRDASLIVFWRRDVKPSTRWESFKLLGFKNNSVSAQRFTLDNRGVTFTAVREGETLNALYSLDLASHEVQKLYQHTQADIAETVVDQQDGAVAGVLVYGDRPEYHWLDPKSATAQLYEMLEQRFPGQTVRITGMSEDGGTGLLLVTSDTNPSSYYTLDVPRKQANFLVGAREWLDPGQMRPKQVVQLTARDGTALHGYVTRPAAPDGPYPLVVLPHDGLPGARDRLEFDVQTQLLASRGYAVLQVNFRGSGGYGADFETAGHRQWGGRMQEDISDATRWAIDQGIAAASRICIFGVGLGGYAALMGAVREPQLYRCAAAYSGVYDLDLFVRDHNLADYRRGAERYDEVFFGTSAAQLRQQSPAYNAERIQVPVLLMHDKRDQRAGFNQALRMKSALERNNQSFEWLVLDRSSQEAAQDNRAKAYERLLAFLERHLSAPAH